MKTVSAAAPHAAAASSCHRTAPGPRATPIGDAAVVPCACVGADRAPRPGAAAAAPAGTPPTKPPGQKCCLGCAGVLCGAGSAPTEPALARPAHLRPAVCVPDPSLASRRVSHRCREVLLWVLGWLHSCIDASSHHASPVSPLPLLRIRAAARAAFARLPSLVTQAKASRIISIGHIRARVGYGGCALPQGAGLRVD